MLSTIIIIALFVAVAVCAYKVGYAGGRCDEHADQVLKRLAEIQKNPVTFGDFDDGGR